MEPRDLAELLTYARLDGVAAASWEPEAGFADGRLTAQTFAARAAEQGARIRPGTTVGAARFATIG